MASPTDPRVMEAMLRTFGADLVRAVANPSLDSWTRRIFTETERAQGWYAMTAAEAEDKYGPRPAKR